MVLSEIIGFLETVAPPVLQEEYDNSGLIVGNKNDTINKALICLDSTPDIIEEAIRIGANLVIAHHPIVFRGLKKFSGNSHIEQAIIMAIKHDVAIYAIHTNLDNVLKNGVNQKIAKVLGLQNLRILSPKKGLLNKLVVYCPDAHADILRQALFKAGAGHINNYDSCSFNIQGQGTFRPKEGAKPYVGEVGQLHWEPETRIEAVFPSFKTTQIIKAMLEAHPYEEVAHEIIRLENQWSEVGSGLIGEFSEERTETEFLQSIKDKMHAPVIRFTQRKETKGIKKVAVCGGSGSFLLQEAMAQKADVFMSSDFKYHQFFESEGKIMIADIGHYEGEYFTIELLGDLLKEKFPTFAVDLTGIRTNPINYYC